MGCNCKSKKSLGIDDSNEDKGSFFERLFLFVIVLLFLPIIIVGSVLVISFKYLLSVITGEKAKINIDWLYKLREKYKKNEGK